MVRDIDDSGSQTKVWLDYPEDVDLLANVARDDWEWKRRIAILLMGKCGLRASGIQSAKPKGLTYNEQGDFWELTVKGKNTNPDSNPDGDNSKKTRQAYVPLEVKRELDNYWKSEEIAPNEPFVDVSVDSIRRWVREAASKLTDKDENWQYVSSHDLRRAWANYHLVEKEVSIRVMMDIGGWSRVEAIEPYLNKPSSQKKGAELNALH